MLKEIELLRAPFQPVHTGVRVEFLGLIGTQVREVGKSRCLRHPISKHGSMLSGTEANMARAIPVPQLMPPAHCAIKRNMLLPRWQPGKKFGDIFIFWCTRFAMDSTMCAF